MRKFWILSILFLLSAFPSTRATAEEGLSLKDLAIPESLGKVESRLPGTSDYWVIQIQAVHTHFTAQENIAAIIDHINRHYDVDTVGLEGGWSETTFPESWGIPSSRQKQLFARELLERDYLNGAAFAALFSETPLYLIGIEEKETYEKNRAVFIEHLEIRKALLEKMSSWEKKITLEKQETYNPSLYLFDQALLKFRAGKNAEKFLPELIRSADKKQVHLNDLSQVMLFKQIIEKEELLDKDKLKSEAARLMKQFKKLGLNFEELLRSGKIPKERLEFYPATQHYMEIMDLRDGLRYQVFFEELETAITRLKEKLFVSEEERKIDAESSRAGIARAMIFMEATPRDLKQFKAQKETLLKETKMFELDHGLELAINFYAFAKKRDQVFFNQVTQDERLQNKNIVTVTGGFHTEGFSQRLQEKGISHIIITPDLGDQEPNKELYFQRIQQALPGASAIETPIETSFLHPQFDSGFLKGLRTLSETRNILKAVETLKEVLGGSQKATIATSQNALTMEAFLKLSPTEQSDTLKGWFVLNQTSNVSVGALGMQQNLVSENPSPVSLHALKEYKAQRQNTLMAVVPFEGVIHTELIGGKAKIRRIRADSITQAIKQPSIQRNIRALDGRFVIIDSAYKAQDVLVLPPKDFILLLVRAILEGHLKVSENPETLNRFWNQVESLLTKIELDAQVRASA